MNIDHPSYFAVGGFYELSPISNVDYRYRIPRFRCPICGNDEMAYHLGYPHLDPAEVLSTDERGLIDRRRQKSVSDPNELIALAKRLEARWGVPVASGAHFCPLRIKVGSKAKLDFAVETFGCDFFIRRRAAELLRAEGFDFDSVSADAYGKHAAEADFIQLVVPIVAHCSIPKGATFCSHCKRVNRTNAIKETTILFDSPSIQGLPFFLPLEAGILYASADFIEAAKRLNLQGLIESKTIRAMPVAADPEPSRPPLRWIRLKDVEKPERSIASKIPVETARPIPKLDRTFAKHWVERLQTILEKVKTEGGESKFEIGSATSSKSTVAASIPEPVRTLLKACGGKLSFSYTIAIADQEFSGYLDLDVKLMKKYKADCKKWAEDTWLAEESDEQEIWLKAIPFAALKNGDYLALDGRECSDDPPVVYLAHDDSSERLSRSLREFLQTWEALRYIGPESWLLSEFVDPRTGFLSGETEAAQKLTKLI